jgi:hypothetical protein
VDWVQAGKTLGPNTWRVNPIVSLNATIEALLLNTKGIGHAQSPEPDCYT